MRVATERHWGIVLGLLVLGLAVRIVPVSAAVVEGESPSTADHHEFEALDGPFDSAIEVTRACLGCHSKAAEQVRRTIHWRWEFRHPESGQLLGKRHVINSFCGSVWSNEPRCTSCHVGYGWTDMRKPPPRADDRVDCLVCHDTTGTYWKLPAGAGHPPYAGIRSSKSSGAPGEPVNLARVARNVGLSGRANCGSCHFYGGGGDGVKHGDLDSSLVDPPRSLDVHMSAQGADFRCAECHTSRGHRIAGSRYATNARDTQGIDIPGRTDGSRASCESCHGPQPHGAAKLNDHVDRVACQSCHVPEFARGGVATKMWWDWSSAGRLGEDGQPLTIRDAAGHLSYLSTKGSFRYAEDVVPAYYWFDGDMRYTLRSEPIDADHPPVAINRFGGGPDDAEARIWPFKVMRGRQPYDTVNRTLLVNHVYGNDDTALWTNFDWARALAAGTAFADQPYSGEYGFVETVMYWPITHMVAPASAALDCGVCHARDGRLAALGGFYLPGRDRGVWVERLGWGLVVLVLVASLGHAGVRLWTRGRRGRQA
ncbi:tetrathionate reductase family octaheme c-type cytochrome [Arhodomonas sp. KWT]|uniref:tetrathionate reductase family octaheme c-type cytochrome n=1 Tax=Arhodomonas sp. KWT TaxID=2679915 RepID=UPI001F0953F6|nr:tetrathionate reductase family octaheme c-type cytochrome [Arhodomonas sp. KWT]